jgi:FkbM family methyltransferase
MSFLLRNMPRVKFADLKYAALHPMRAWQYLRRHDRISYETCARYLPPAPIIVEAGAYDGSNTLDFCRFWPDCQVYAFEPVPGAYVRLLEVADELPKQVHPQNLALGSRTGISEMHVSVTGASGGEQSSSLMAPTGTREEFPFVDFCEKAITVSVSRLDEWAANEGVSDIDFMWLDLQGMELAALEGCGGLLSRVSAIHLEVQNIPLYEGAPLYPEISRWLHSRGFRVVQEAVFRRGGNVLFVRRK